MNCLFVVFLHGTHANMSEVLCLVFIQSWLKSIYLNQNISAYISRIAFQTQTSENIYLPSGIFKSETSVMNFNMKALPILGSNSQFRNKQVLDACYKYPCYKIIRDIFVLTKPFIANVVWNTNLLLTIN
jgi:hypothetical protein